MLVSKATIPNTCGVNPNNSPQGDCFDATEKKDVCG